MDAKVVLDELGRRLRIIEDLQELIERKDCDELHELQPVFERGLWIFGPEYERVDFTSNKTLATVLRNLLAGKKKALANPKWRPDFVVLPDRSIGVYSADAYDQLGEVGGLSKVLVVELKRVGLRLTRDELRQGEDYALELRKGNKVQPSTDIIVYVLGKELGEDAAEEKTVGAHTVIRPLTYSTFLHKAHARTFGLYRRIQEAAKISLIDQDVEEVLSQPELL